MTASSSGRGSTWGVHIAADGHDDDTDLLLRLHSHDLDRSVTMEPRPAQKWEYLAVPFKDAGDLKKNSEDLSPSRLNQLGSEGWEAVGLSLKRGDLVAWPVVLLKRPVDEQ